jgi:hypothetical protein
LINLRVRLQERSMDHAQYLRDRAAEFANKALTTADPAAAQSFHALAILCRGSAERLAHRAAQREAHPA